MVSGWVLTLSYFLVSSILFLGSHFISRFALSSPLFLGSVLIAGEVCLRLDSNLCFCLLWILLHILLCFPFLYFFLHLVLLFTKLVSNWVSSFLPLFPVSLVISHYTLLSPNVPWIPSHYSWGWFQAGFWPFPASTLRHINLLRTLPSKTAPPLCPSLYTVRRFRVN